MQLIAPQAQAYEDIWHHIWTEETPVEGKLHGSLEDMRCTASFVRKAGVSIRVNDKKINTNSSFS
jgi:hypothetical protein